MRTMRSTYGVHANSWVSVKYSDLPTLNTTILPQLVNNYRKLNTNTILDMHPLPHVDNILADCAKSKIWSKLDMMNSFFQTRVHPDNIHLTAVTTLFGLYEWLTMPMGL